MPKPYRCQRSRRRVTKVIRYSVRQGVTRVTGKVLTLDEDRAGTSTEGVYVIRDLGWFGLTYNNGDKDAPYVPTTIDEAIAAGLLSSESDDAEQREIREKFAAFRRLFGADDG